MVSRCKKLQGLACQQFRREGLIYNGNSGSRRALRRAVVCDGEDTVSPAPGSRIKGSEGDFALRFHLHPAVKASRLSDGRGVMLVLPNRDVWTFEALDDKVDLEDSVFLAGNDGPRRTAQIVIRQDSRQATSIRWNFVRSSTSAAATNARRNARREPELPL